MSHQNKTDNYGFYEQYRESANKVIIMRNIKVVYPPHFHMNIEVFIVKRGEFEVTLNEKKYAVTDDNVLFCSSYDVHGYDKESISTIENNNDYAIVLIPPLLLKDFYTEKKDARPRVPIIKSAKLCENLLEITDRLLSDNNLSATVTRAAINLFLAYIETEFDFTNEKNSRSPNIIRDMLDYILKNYRENISLEKIAKHLGYSPEHLSRIFHSYFNQSVSSYINKMRLDYVENELKNKPKSKKISDLAFEAGFQSIQSYYRARNNNTTTY